MKRIYFLLVVFSSAICPSTSQEQCLPGVPIYQCFVEPCLNKVCAKYPEATCVANYCGGCKAKFYLNNQTVECDGPGNATVRQRKIGCPENVTVATCLVSPCYRRYGRCENFPEAVCKEDYCGGCNYYFEVNGETVQCSTGRGVVVLIIDMVSKIIQYFRFFLSIFGLS